MQPHQYVLAMGVLWLASLIVLPFLFAITRRRAFASGLDAGKHIVKVELKQQIKSLQGDLAEDRAQSEADQRKHQKAVATLKSTIAELEVRIMSYTGMPVTRADHDLLVSATETLRLTERTLKALKAEQQANRAAEQAISIEGLAKRIHAQLRDTPASAAKVEVAA